MRLLQPGYGDLGGFHAVTFAGGRSRGLRYTEEVGSLLGIGLALMELRFLYLGA